MTRSRSPRRPPLDRSDRREHPGDSEGRDRRVRRRHTEQRPVDRAHHDHNGSGGDRQTPAGEPETRSASGRASSQSTRPVRPTATARHAVSGTSRSSLQTSAATAERPHHGREAAVALDPEDGRSESGEDERRHELPHADPRRLVVRSGASSAIAAKLPSSAIDAGDGGDPRLPGLREEDLEGIPAGEHAGRGREQRPAAEGAAAAVCELVHVERDREDEHAASQRERRGDGSGRAATSRRVRSRPPRGGTRARPRPDGRSGTTPRRERSTPRTRQRRRRRARRPPAARRGSPPGRTRSSASQASMPVSVRGSRLGRCQHAGRRAARARAAATGIAAAAVDRLVEEQASAARRARARGRRRGSRTRSPSAAGARRGAAARGRRRESTRPPT